MVWVFMVIIFLLVGTYFIIDSTKLSHQNPLQSNYALSDSLVLLIESQDKNNGYKKWKIDSLFVFDPNKIDKSGLLMLGFKEKIADRLLKYRAKVPFRHANDLKKLYGIDPSFIDTLAPYMVFEKSTKSNFQTPYSSFKKNEYQKEKYEEKKDLKEKTLVHINSATSEELTLLKGIGPTLSLRIEKYREKLGGFINEWQLLEVYGIDSSVIINNKSILYLDSDKIKKIKINNIEWKELVAHPYIDGKTATLLINYRKQHGNYKSIDDFRKIKILSTEFIERIADYIDFAE